MTRQKGGNETMDLEKLKTIKAVVFDMDGLMFDSESNIFLNITEMIFHLMNFYRHTERHIMIWQKMGHQQKKDCMRFWKC